MQVHLISVVPASPLGALLEPLFSGPFFSSFSWPIALHQLEPLLVALLASCCALVVSRMGAPLERSLFCSAASRVWQSMLEAPAPGRRGLASRMLFVVASGPFKAPFVASLALLTLSERIHPTTATALLALLYVLRCASTGQPHTEHPVAQAWRSQHGAPPNHPFRVPLASLQRLAQKSHEASGHFEREDVRAYVVIAALLHATRSELPSGLHLAWLLVALAVPVWMMADTRRAIVGSVPSKELSSERTLRRFLVTVGCSLAASFGAHMALPSAGPLPSAVLVALSLGLFFVATALELLAFGMGFGSHMASHSQRMASADGTALVVNPVALRKVRYRRDIGISRGAERGVPLLRWMRLRAWFESFGFAQTMRASSRVDLLLTSTVLASWLF